MRNFARAVRLALKFRFTLVGTFLCSSLVAVFWGANIGTVYPFIEVVFQGDSLHQWVDGQIEKTEQTSAEIRGTIQQLEAERARAPDAAQQAAIERKLAFQQSRLQAEQKAQARARWLQPAIHRYLPDNAFQTLVLVVVFLLAGTLAKDTFLVLNLLLVARLAQLGTLQLRNEFYRRTLQLELSAFSQGRTGDLMSRFTGDMRSVNDGIVVLLGKLVREPLKMTACVIGAALISWRLLVLSLLVTPLAFFLMYRLGRAIKRANRRAMEEMGMLYNRLAESLNGIQAVKAFTMERLERSRFRQIARQFYQKSMRITLFDSLTRLNTELLGVGVICLGLLGGGYLVLHQETHLLGIKMTERPLSFGSLMLFYAFLVGTSDPARKLADVLAHLQRAAAAADRVYTMLDRSPTIADPPDPQPLPHARGELVFDHVHFHYAPGQPILEDIHLHVRSGETLAIVGPNGCGKSTLVNLIPRFYDPVQGAVRLDYLDLRHVRQRDLRRRIGMVTQQTVLFDDTILNNIRYGSPHAAREQVIEAARKAHAHSFIEQTLAEGYETHVGESGGRLSGGQRQRIALARAILRDPDILILDEATSQVDPESEQLIHQALELFLQDRTAILITHRMSTLTLADRILVMQSGRILDLGTHQELIGRCDLYRRLNQGEFKETA